MRSVAVLTVVAMFFILFTFGCDSRQASIERGKKIFTTTPDVGKLQADNAMKVKQSLEKYKADFGEYPQRLGELKAQGYDVPDPSEGWVWQYRVNPEIGPQLQPIRSQ